MKALGDTCRISAMCKYLKMSTNMFYCKAKDKYDDTVLENAVVKVFKASGNNYGTRKLKVELSKEECQIIVSRRKLCK